MVRGGIICMSELRTYANCKLQIAESGRINRHFFYFYFLYSSAICTHFFSQYTPSINKNKNKSNPAKPIKTILTEKILIFFLKILLSDIPLNTLKFMYQYLK